MSIRTLLTAREFAESGPLTDGYELVRGELFPMPPPRPVHGLVCANVVALLKIYTQRTGRGQVMANDVGIRTRKDPDTVRGMDVALFLAPSWLPGGPPEGYLEEAPTLVVEVRSREQPWRDLLEKVQEYLTLGVPLIWVVDPTARRVTIFRQEQAPETLAQENDIDGGDIIPGFHCHVADFFD